MKIFISILSQAGKESDLIKQVYVYRGYGNLILENYFDAATDYKESEKFGSLETNSLYNKFIALGLHAFKS